MILFWLLCGEWILGGQEWRQGVHPGIYLTRDGEWKWLDSGVFGR